jgi:localization factor PodJL
MRQLAANGAASPVGAGQPAAAAPAEGPLSLPPVTVGPFSMRLAAAQGDPSAQFEVAARLAEGKGSTEQDIKEAMRWYERSAASGFAMAQFRLGTLYERGLGVKADIERAKVWYTRAAEQGNVKAMHNLAVIIASRSGDKADYNLAAKWFQEAAARGLADSQFNLAVLYENGLGVGKDEKEAYKWLILASRSGDKESTARRDALKARMKPDDVKAAEALAARWSAKFTDPIANDFRTAGQAWRRVGPNVAARR